MIRRRLAWPAAILLWTVAVSVVTYGAVWPSARPVVALPFLVVCPGMAWTRLLGLKPAMTELLLAVALSLAIDTLVSTALLYAHLPSARATLGGLVAITLGGLLADPSLRNLLARPVPHREVVA